ncbi:MAG: META domain-containing protein [Sphingomonadaceae bacterium]
MIRLAILPALPLLAACAMMGNAETPQLAGTEWRFVAIDGQAPVSDRARMGFTAKQISATAGCNGIGGTWKLEGERLVGGPYASTMMFCDGLMEQERAIGDLLAEQPMVSITSNRLTLTSASHKAELVRAD